MKNVYYLYHGLHIHEVVHMEYSNVSAFDYMAAVAQITLEHCMEAL